MRALIDPNDVPVGAHFAVFDTIDADWSLWEKIGPSEDLMHVSWEGEIVERRSDGRWVAADGRFRAYIIRPENVDTIVMAARHLPDKHAWYRFAARQAERQSERQAP